MFSSTLRPRWGNKAAAKSQVQRHAIGEAIITNRDQLEPGVELSRLELQDRQQICRSRVKSNPAQTKRLRILRQHRFANPGGLRPDMVLRRAGGGQQRWLVVEVKLYGQVQFGARAALQNLLAYRRAFDAVLAGNSGVYGLGIAWGTDLHPAPAEIVLCTPDTIPAAIRQFAG